MTWPLALLHRFWQKVEPGDNGCWNWKGALHPDGYGEFWNGCKVTGAHRWAYELFIGPIPFDRQLDHLCRNRRCVNPRHLEAVTTRENTRRGDSFAGVNFRKTECNNGHPLIGANLHLYQGRRICRACNRQAVARYKQRQVSS